MYAIISCDGASIISCMEDFQRHFIFVHPCPGQRTKSTGVFNSLILKYHVVIFNQWVLTSHIPLSLNPWLEFLKAFQSSPLLFSFPWVFGSSLFSQSQGVLLVSSVWQKVLFSLAAFYSWLEKVSLLGRELLPAIMTVMKTSRNLLYPCLQYPTMVVPRAQHNHYILALYNLNHCRHGVWYI